MLKASMKELIITFITLAGLIIGVKSYDSIMKELPQPPQQVEQKPAAQE